MDGQANLKYRIIVMLITWLYGGSPFTFRLIIIAIRIIIIKIIIITITTINIKNFSFPPRISSSRFVVKPDGVNNVFFMYFWLNQWGSMKTWGSKGTRWGLNPPTNRALRLSRVGRLPQQYSISGKTKGGSAMYFWLNQWGVNENLGVERH